MSIREVAAAWIVAGLLAFNTVWAADQNASNLTLAEAFRLPPASARPHCFWYWMGGYISREGLTADLEAMKRGGLGGAMIFNIAGHGPEGPVPVFSPQWRELMRHAIREAGRLGLQINLNNSMQGWSSSGGPWITPELAMQKLAWSETRVHGGATFDGVLPQPPTKLDTYRDVAVLAFPTPPIERMPDPVPTIAASDPAFHPQPLVAGQLAPPDGSPWRDPKVKPAPAVPLAAVAKGQTRFLQLDYARPFAPRSLHLAFAGSGVKGKLETSEDGTQWRPVRSFEPRGPAPVDLAFRVAPAHHWRIVFSEEGPVRLTEVLLSARYRLDEWTAKAMFDMYERDNPPFTDEADTAPEDTIIHREQIVDLASTMDASGHVRWEPPAGEWTILRFGYTPTGSLAHAGGLECDKFNPAALDVHFQNALQPWFDDPELNRCIQYVHVDSYEKGAQNWTARLPDEFAKRQRYELRSYLPVLTGRVVNSVRESERFLWDFRNTTISLMHEHYFGHMRELCHRAGKQFTCEPYHMSQFNNVTAGGQTDIPMCECWMGDSIPGPYWPKLGASPAHVYGKPIVMAEAFTSTDRDRSGGKWDTDFWAMKELGDAMLCGGVNRMAFHVYAHQPWMNVAPGQSLGPYGTHFERTNTWWEQMPGFTGYLSRCQHLLQQGLFVADVLYSSGENSPNTSVSPAGTTAMPRGYDYDVCDPYVIFHRLRVQDGRLVLPEGGSYRLLVLPDDRAMTPAMARRIGELVHAGATVVAPKPTHSPSLFDQPNADEEVHALAQTIWADCDGRKATQRTYGQGRVFWGQPLSEVLSACGIQPDVETPANKPLVRYIHRKLKEGELYFLASSSPQFQTMDVAFHTAEGSPCLWDPISGQSRSLPEYRRESGRTMVPLQFEPRQSYFVLFGTSASPTSDPRARKNFPGFRRITELAGAWDVRFDPKWGGPAQVTFEKLEDWTKRPESGIKYYSGKATYRKQFDLPATPARRAADGNQPVGQASGLPFTTDSQAGSLRHVTDPLYLDLGTIKNVAEVRLNGQALGIVWCAPWRLEITSAVKPAGNELEIDVVNLWPNRMIGDEQLPADGDYNKTGWLLLKHLPDWFVKGQPRTSGRYTFSIHQPWTKDSPLFESGLLGPVRVLVAE